MQFSLLNSSDIKMVPQYCSYGSAGVPAVPATIFMSVYETVLRVLFICLKVVKEMEYA